MSEPVTGVLVMAYGTPATPDDVEAYYTHVRRGRPPTPELLADLRRRYDAIGGTSPLLERTQEQAAGIQAALGDGYHVELGMKHAPPFVEDGVAALAAAGVRRIVGLVLAPHYSALSVGEYATRATATAADAGVDLVMVTSWHLAPGYVDLLTGLVRDEVDRLGAAPTEVVFTAHSLPSRILEMGDPYPDQLAETAEAVALAAGLDRWSVAWQSAGRTPEPWIGPDLLTVLPTLADAGAAGVVVCAAGFVSDHLELLYDLDIEARDAAGRLGLAFARTPSPNARPAFCATLAGVVREADRAAAAADAGSHA
ncbi:MAG: ferrochelatase [Actinomycetota bacterium]|nr:ferrochelatase [Actinomycetota bacterium]